MPQRCASIMGDFEAQNIGHPREYFVNRGICLDCRGPVRISAGSMWGFYVLVLTGTHRLSNRDVVYRPVTVEAEAWIASNATLFNCHVGRGAVVAAGSVISGRNVPPYTMVEGNPAQIVAYRNRYSEEWLYFEKSIPLRRHHGHRD